MGDGQSPAQTAYIAVIHETGGHGRIEHWPDLVAEVERDGGNSHRRPDARCRLAGQMRGYLPLERGQHLSKTPTNSAVGPDERSFRGHQTEIKVRQPLLIYPSEIQQHVTEGPGACCVSSE